MALQGLALEFSARLSALFSGAASAEEAVDRLEATYGAARVRRWDEALLSSVGTWAVASVGDGPDACDLAMAMSTFALGAVRLEHWTATVYLAASGPGASAGFRVEFFFFLFPLGEGGLLTFVRDSLLLASRRPTAAQHAAGHYLHRCGGRCAWPARDVCHPRVCRLKPRPQSPKPRLARLPCVRPFTSLLAVAGFCCGLNCCCELLLCVDGCVCRGGCLRCVWCC